MVEKFNLLVTELTKCNMVEKFNLKEANNFFFLHSVVELSTERNRDKQYKG